MTKWPVNIFYMNEFESIDQCLLRLVVLKCDLSHSSTLQHKYTKDTGFRVVV